MEFRSHRLDNGLEIVAECNDSAHSLGVGFFVRTGARDETDDVAGVSHFLEHMCFKGTARRSAEDVNREFDEIGAHYNAFTSEESTVYYASLLPEYQEASIDLLADIVRPSLREDDFTMEKKVILEEIQMYLDQPPYGMDDHIKELHLGNHPLARSVLGTAGSITKLGADQMRTYFEDRYGPQNVFVGAAGHVAFDALVEQVAARCGDWKPTAARRDAPPAEPRPRFEVVQREATTQQYVLQLADAPSCEDDDRYAAKLLVTILGDDTGSRMYWELTDPGLAESASLGHYEYQGAGMYYAWMACRPEEAQANLQRLADIYATVERDGVTGPELIQAKNKVKARIVLSSERPRNRLFNVGGNWLQRREYRSVNDDLDAINVVSVEDIRRVLSRYPISAHTTVAVGPLKELHPPDSGKQS
jgi:predicted Zn-dependent peptidase